VISNPKSGIITVCTAKEVSRSAISVKVGVPEGREKNPSAVRIAASVGVAVVIA